MRLLSFIFFFLDFTLCFAQSSNIAPNKDFYKPSDNLPKSPESSGLFRYSQFPIDHSSGAVNISIPIHTIRAGRIELPVTISYNTSGIKVQDVSSMIGLGWSLNFGYCITVAEEEKKLLFDPVRNFKTEAQASAVTESERGLDWLLEMKRTADGYYPTTKTIYKYNCGSLTGSFFYDDENRLRLAGEQMNTKIEKMVTSQGNLAGFKITTGDAIEYIFNQLETTTRISQDSPPVGSQTTAFWCSQATDLLSGEKITFTYVQKPVYEDTSNETYTYTYTNETVPGNCWLPFETSYRMTRYQVQGLQIDKIAFPDGFLLFNTNQSRQDIDKTELTSIGIYSSIQQSIKKKQVNFHHSYFLSSGGSRPEYNYRLKLDSLTIQPIYQQQARTSDKYSFNYDNTALPPYRQNTTLGEVNSTSVDYWGYNNGRTGGEWLIPVKVRDDVRAAFPSGASSTSASNREADPIYTKSAVLTKINYPTGGFAKFEYENHQLQNYYLGSTLGGLRIKRLQYFDSQTAAIASIKKTFNYTSVQQLTPASLNMYAYWKRKVTAQATFPCGAPVTAITMSNNPLYGIAYYHGSPVFYDTVEELEGTDTDNIGKTVYKYVSYTPPYALSSFKETGGRKLISYDPGSAKPISIEIFKKGTNNSFELISKELFEYGGATPDSVGNYHGVQPGGNYRMQVGFGVSKNDRLGIYYQTMPTTEVSMDLVGPDADGKYEQDARQHALPTNTFLYNDFHILPAYNRLIIKKKLTYNNNIEQTVTENYFYDSPNHQQLTRKELVDSKGVVKKVIYKYMKDWYEIYDINNNANNSILTALARANYAEQILQTESFVNNILVSKSKNEFALKYNNTLNTNIPVIITNIDSTYLGNTKEERSTHILKYNEQLKPLSQQFENGPILSNIWDEGAIYLLAQARNSTYDDVYYTSFESKAPGKWNFAGMSTFDSNASSGTSIYKLDGTNDITTENNLSTNKTYILTYSSRNGAYNVPGTLSTQQVGSAKGWSIYVHTITGQSSIKISGNGDIDELRLFPQGAQMTTYTYEPLVGMTSQTDAKGETTYYEYDSFQRLKTVKDQNGNILKQYDYHYQNQ